MRKYLTVNRPVARQCRQTRQLSRLPEAKGPSANKVSITPENANFSARFHTIRSRNRRTIIFSEIKKTDSVYYKTWCVGRRSPFGDSTRSGTWSAILIP